MKRYKLVLVGVILVVLGGLARLAEELLYGGQVDDAGVVQESFFLPLSFLLLILGALLLLGASGLALAGIGGRQ